MEELKKTIEEAIEGVRKGEIGPRVDTFKDYKSKYTVLKQRVAVKVELTDGKVFEIDVSDYFQKGE